MGELNLAIHCSDGRNVRVEVELIPELPPTDVHTADEPALDRWVHRQPIDEGDVGSGEALRERLAAMTYSSPDHGVVQAGLPETLEDDFLRSLGVPGPPPDPIPVNLAQGG
jgi:hypothetical protein